jgi:hypothetical protein
MKDYLLGTNARRALRHCDFRGVGGARLTLQATFSGVYPADVPSPLGRWHLLRGLLAAGGAAQPVIF